jgi:hypothetical protein
MEHAFGETTYSFSSEAPRPRERRRDPRQITILRVGTLIVGRHRELCLVRNISAGGLMAHVYMGLEEGQQLAVELRSGQLIPGSVSWIDGSNVGISFDRPIDVEEMLAAQAVLDNGWRPRLPRVEVDRLATLRIGARVYPVSTVDISQGGVKLETDQPFEVGEDVVLSLDRFRPLQGVVRWTHGGLCGVSFNQIVPFHELMRWLRD